MISKGLKYAFYKKLKLPHCHRRAAQSQTARVKAHSGDAIQFLTVQRPHPIGWSIAVIADEEKSPIAQQAVASHTMSPTLQQDNDIS